MSYGWVRSEILGGLTNGCFLLSLCLYVALESIPRFIDPPEFDSGWPFIIVAACGLGINTFGTIVFACTPHACPPACPVVVVVVVAFSFLFFCLLG
jgi:Co/Zn/Cd efflux system component